MRGMGGVEQSSSVKKNRVEQVYIIEYSVVKYNLSNL